MNRRLEDIARYALVCFKIQFQFNLFELHIRLKKLQLQTYKIQSKFQQITKQNTNVGGGGDKQRPKAYQTLVHKLHVYEYQLNIN